MHTRKYSPELLDTSKWPTVDTSLLSESDRIRYMKLEGAVKAWCNEEKPSSINKRFGVSRSLLFYYLQRCTANHSDGRLMGFRALIPNSERKQYISVAEERNITEMGAGYAGAFHQLLAKHPSCSNWLEKQLDPQKSSINPGGLNLTSLHSGFLTQLKKAGVSVQEYPFTTVRNGYSALCAYVRKRIAEGDDRWALMKYGENSQIYPKKNSGKISLFRPLYPFERVAYDEYQLPDIATVSIVTDDEEEAEVPISRAYFCPLVDFASESVLGYSFAIGRSFSSKNIGKAFECAINPPLVQEHPAFSNFAKLDGEGFPTSVIPGVKGRRFGTLCLDNHLSHLSNSVVIDLRNRVGVTITYGAVRSWIERNVVERIFSELQLELSRLPSTTGSGIGDIKVSNPVGQAVKHKIRVKDLLALVHKLVARHNAITRPGLYGLSPNVCIAKSWGATSRLQIVPLYSDDFIQSPQISVEKELVTVRGDRSKGRVPYVQLDEVEYTNDYLRQNWSMIGKKLIVHIVEDFRSVVAYRPEGTEFGRLSVSGGWAVRSHTRETRKQINRLRKDGKMDYRSGDPVGSYIEYLAEIALKTTKNKKTPKITREANALARVLAETGHSELRADLKKSDEAMGSIVRAKNRSSFFVPRKGQ